MTILETFAFLVEALLYRANRIPERDRAKFLTLLGVPLAPARAARAAVAFVTKDGPPVTLAAGAALQDGGVPFVTESALDVLSGESRVLVKQTVALDPDREAEYRDVYKTLQVENPDAARLLPARADSQIVPPAPAWRPFPPGTPRNLPDARSAL